MLHYLCQPLCTIRHVLVIRVACTLIECNKYLTGLLCIAFIFVLQSPKNRKSQ
ncbi:hypothetical protein BDV38DRAFT_234030 [Aspergillus pseudotamarii]|uniref:Uncharacterized protein n=1 Tax=Aspergillus pseudotamarii TaxID=132259 RepID=A0A5N6T917_ASPPS|nr:uncharacterized protein BDV38DRAFT_234030 [Aspergillus pseudotamarii]KAE8142776.1 hypothetical protein BDV38DRAFT_234030 [Aspergillus pseudotamarii]